MADGIRVKVTLAGEDLGIFDPNELTMDLAMQLEDKTSMTITDLVTGMGRVSARALQALVWLQRLQAGHPADLHANFKFKDLVIVDADAGADAGPTVPADAEATTGTASETSDAGTLAA